STGTGVVAELGLAAGETATYVLEESGMCYAFSEGETGELFDRTVAYWRRWLAQSRYQGRWREMVNRSALTLKLLTYAPSGGIDGRAELPEEVLSHLEGYRGSAPVRVGNRAADQLQLDIYGELIDSVYLYNKYGTPISYDAWNDLTRIVEWVGKNWDQADEGI